MWYSSVYVSISTSQFTPPLPYSLGFPGSSAAKESACNEGDPGSIPEEGNSYPLQYFSLENSMNWGHWQATVHGVTKSRTQLSDFHFHFLSLNLLQPKVCFLHPWFYFFFVKKFICTIFFLDSTYKQYHMIFFSLSDLLDLVWQSLSPSMFLQMALFCSFLWLSNIPLYIDIYMHHSFFIHSSIDGHSGCFHVLANSVAMDTVGHKSKISL